jgi:hypothetical protein
MSSKVTVEIKVKVLVNLNDGENLTDIIDEMEYDFSDTTGNADVVDTEITGWEVLDSR